MKVVLVDLGSQYTPVLKRRLGEFGLEVLEKSPSQLGAEEFPVILSGGPGSAGDQLGFTKTFISSVRGGQVKVLGICLGHQWLASVSGGKIHRGKTQEYGLGTLSGSSWNNEVVWMSHGDAVDTVSDAWEILARSDDVIAAIKHRKFSQIGLQFHPEVFHTKNGRAILEDCLKIFGVTVKIGAKISVSEVVRKIQAEVGQSQVILGLSGGVDSLVVATLLEKAIPGKYKAVFVDTGLMRKYDVRDLLEVTKKLGLEVIVEKSDFISSLEGISDPEKKRKIIGAKFIDVFSDVTKRLGSFQFLAQGTLASDVIESQGSHMSANIKSHHNVGGLPEKLGFRLCEPIRSLFKDQVRELGKELGLGVFADRHPFPGPGLAIRILGEVTSERVTRVAHADEILFEELKKANLYNKTWQAFTVGTGISSVGVKGDNRSYEEVLALRAVDSVDGMTASVSRLPWEFWENVARRIVNEVHGVGRVVFDVTTKPPATIEWE